MTRADSPLKDRMIFNVGARRSGTFWLQRIVTAHPDVDAVPAETHFFSDGIAPLFNRFSHGLKGTPQVGQIWMDREELLDATRDFCDRVLAAQFESGARFLAERTPIHVFHLDLIADLYPDAQVVHIIRDGRDVARSLLNKQWGPNSMEEAAKEWAGSVRAGREAKHPRTYIEVIYERLLADPEPEITRLFDGLGLAVTDAALAAAVAEAGESVNVDAAQPQVASGKWRGALSARDLKVFEDIAGDVLDELGYERAARRGPRLRGLRRRGAEQQVAEPAGAATATEATPGYERPETPLPPARPPTGGLGARMAIDVLNDLLAAMKAGDSERAEDLLVPDGELRVVTGTETRTSNGETARRDLAALISEDDVPKGKQRRSEVFVQPSGVAGVLGFELADGTEAERIYVISAQGERIGSLVVYQV